MDLEFFGVSAVLLIVGLVQLAKSAGFSARYAGVLAVALGVAAALGYTLWAGQPLFRAVVTGLALGLSAAGLYSTQKSVRE